MKLKTESLVSGLVLCGALVLSTGVLDVKAGAGSGVYPVTVTDDLGNAVTIEEEPANIVSLSPAGTEILYAVGAGDKVVGRTDYCNYPEEAAKVESIGSYSEPNTELIISLSPDVVFASDYIDDDVRGQLEDAGAKVIVFTANTIDAVEKDIVLAGQVMNTEDKAKEVTDQMDTELNALKESVQTIDEQKSVFLDLGSYYSVGKGSLLGDVLNVIGVTNVAADTDETWPQLSVESIIEKNPDIYLSLFTTPEELKAVSGLSDLDCIANDQIIYYDGLSPEADTMQRPGPRSVEGAKLLAEAIYPELRAE